MRSYLRHPTDIPIRYRLSDNRQSGSELLRNVGHGGLCFQTSHFIASGTELHITIALYGPPFEADGVVVWCKPLAKVYEVGVQFQDEETEFAVRMVEQACQIEHYKREVLTNEGRVLDGEEAAEEWIEKFAKQFPS